LGYRFIGAPHKPDVPVKVEPEARAQAMAAIPDNFVGRREVLSKLNETWQRAAAGQRQLLWVAGDAGVGKTTLLETEGHPLQAVRRELRLRKLVFFGLVWLGGVLAFRTFATTDMTFWQISGPLLAMGLGLPIFFVPITSLGLASVEEHEVAGSAARRRSLASRAKKSRDA
jgi:hypothetical protein